MEAVLDRQRAIERYLNGERPAAIYRALGHSREWFYKWLRRFRSGDPAWAEERSRRPRHSPSAVSAAVTTAVVTTRQSLAQRRLFHGAQAISWELTSLGKPSPSERTINRILDRHELVQRAHRYVPKGRPYPALQAVKPGDVHQTDFVGPCYLAGAARFYNLHSVDLASGRCGIERVGSRSSQPVLDAFWAIWRRLGMPSHQQLDNEMVFYGSRAYPRGMGPLIRLCLAHDIEPWFIPPGEPWRNGVVEKFNDIWQQRGPLQQPLAGVRALARANLTFETRHNARYRYSKLGGRTPDAALAATAVPLRFPPRGEAPRHPLPKPETGRYHLVRFVRDDARLDVFGESFKVPAEAAYCYVRATVDVGRQRLSLHLDGRVIADYRYQLR